MTTTQPPKLRSIRGGPPSDDGQPPPPRPKNRLTFVQRMHLHQMIEALLTDGHRPQFVVHVCQQPFSEAKPAPPVSKALAHKLIAEVEEQLLEDGKKERGVNRARALSRLHRARRKAYEARAWHAVAQFENIIARVQGLYEPERVAVSFGLSENLSKVMASYSDEELRALADAQLEVQHKAALYEKAIDAVGEAVPAQVG